MSLFKTSQKTWKLSCTSAHSGQHSLPESSWYQTLRINFQAHTTSHTPVYNLLPSLERSESCLVCGECSAGCPGDGWVWWEAGSCTCGEPTQPPPRALPGDGMAKLEPGNGEPPSPRPVRSTWSFKVCQNKTFFNYWSKSNSLLKIWPHPPKK